MHEAIPEYYAMTYPGGGLGINGGTGQAVGDRTGHVTFYYVEAAELEAALSKIEGLGDSTVMGPTEVVLEGGVPPSRCSPIPRGTS